MYIHTYIRNNNKFHICMIIPSSYIISKIYIKVYIIYKR